MPVPTIVITAASNDANGQLPQQRRKPISFLCIIKKES
ncbi:unnamed protein product, partial [Rotaria magnacalcarata]